MNNKSTESLSIVQIVATNRPGSNTAKIAAHVAEIYAAKGTPLHVLDLALLPPEIFAPSSYAEKPSGFAPFQEAILKANGIVIVTPEYNGGTPGVFKYFLDMLKFSRELGRHAGRVCRPGGRSLGCVAASGANLGHSHLSRSGRFPGNG